MNFFFDRQISVHIARMLADFDRVNSIDHQDDDVRFSPDDEDVYIINTIGSDSPKPVWITADVRQTRNPVERAALRDSGLTIVLFNMFLKVGSFHHQALKALSVWPEIARQASLCKLPTVFEVPFGKIGKLNQKVTSLGPTSRYLR